MIILNFAHPLTDDQLTAVAQTTGREITTVHHIKTQFDQERPFTDQVSTLIDDIGLEPATWQTEPIIVNPPALNYIAVVVLAELHGRMGYFPATIRLKPIPDSMPRQFEFAELINLQTVRDQARTKR